MSPFIMAALSLAQQKANNEQNQINQLNGMQRMQQPNSLGNALSTISSVYGGLFGRK